MRLPLAVAVAAGFCAYAMPSRADEVVKIAYIDPLSGPLASTGQVGEQHFRFAIDQVNATGAAGPGRRFDLVSLANAVSPDHAVGLLRKAIDDGVHYVTQGNGSAVAYALVDAINKNNKREPDKSVIFLNYAAVDPGLTGDKCSPFHFRFDADSDMKMRALSDTIAASKDIHKVYVFNPDYSFGQSVESAAKQMLANRRPDLQVVGAERVALGKVKDFTPYIQKFQAAGAEAVVTGNWGADLALLLKAAADSGYKGTFYTYYLGSQDDIVDAVGQAGRGDAQVAIYANNAGNAEADKIAAEFKAQYHADLTDWQVLEEINMLAAAMKQAGSSDPAKVGSVLATMAFDGPLGHVEMRPDNHQLLQPLFVSVLEPGVPNSFASVNMGFRTVSKTDAAAQRSPTTCKMSNPS